LLADRWQTGFARHRRRPGSARAGRGPYRRDAAYWPDGPCGRAWGGVVVIDMCAIYAIAAARRSIVVAYEAGQRGRPMGVGQRVSRVLRRQADGMVVVPVLSVSGESAPGTAFVPDEVYLEVRIRQMWLTNERELWREYTPFATVVAEFIRRGRRV